MMFLPVFCFIKNTESKEFRIIDKNAEEYIMVYDKSSIRGGRRE